MIQDNSIINYKKDYIYFFLSRLLYIFIFLPYIKIVDLNTDTQINAFIMSIVVLAYLILVKKRLIVNKEIKILFITCMLSIVVGALIDMLSISSLRRIFSYISLFIVSTASYNILNIEKGINERYIKAIIWIWAIIGFIQSFMNPSFATSIVARASTSPTRGVTALAPEPTYYATICMFFIILTFRFKKNKILYLTINIIQIIVFSKSSMIILILFLGIIMYILSKVSNKYFILYICIGICVIFLGYYLIDTYMEHSRVYEIIHKLENPTELIKSDESINQRIGHIYYSVKGFIENFGIPRGYTKWYEYLTLQPYNEYFTLVVPVELIMSGYGASMFELGIISILIIVVFYKSIKYYLDDRYSSIILFIFLTILMFTAIPLSNPVYQFLLAYGLHIRSYKFNNQ